MPVKAIPDGYEAVTPYLVLRNAAAAMAFYTKAFGAQEVMRLAEPDGRIGHAEMRIGKGMIMLADESDGYPGPQTVGGCPITLMIYVEDADRTFATAVAAGGTIKRPLADQFYGDRGGALADPYGYTWWVATHKEDISPEEMKRRMAAMPAGD